MRRVDVCRSGWGSLRHNTRPRLIYIHRTEVLHIEAVASFFGGIMPPTLILVGIFFAVRLRGFYIFHPLRTVKLMTERKGDGISPLRAATMALAGTLGVGNITGVVSAIAMGGAGAIFWMWVSAAAAMSVKYAETNLAVRYRRHDKSGYYGGAPYYMDGGLGKKHAHAVGAFFAVLCVCNAFTVGGVLQVNAASRSAADLTGLPAYAVGVLLAILTLLAVTGGAKRITDVTVWLIPAVSALYIAMCAAVIFINRDAVPAALSAIFKGAFSTRAVGGGVGGSAIASAVRYGVTRGVVTNEAGAGTSPTAHACADAASPEAQGCLGIFEVFADTIVICTLTALAALTSGVRFGGDSMADCIEVFASSLGGGAEILLSLCVFVFVLATLFSQHYYARVALRYLGGGRRAVAVFTVLFTAMIVAGSCMAPPAVWTAADITVGVMTVCNVTCLYIMRREVKAPIFKNERKTKS